MSDDERRLEAERKTPSDDVGLLEEQIAGALDMRFGPHGPNMVTIYRAAVLREAAAARREDDAATRRLIEALHAWAQAATDELRARGIVSHRTVAAMLRVPDIDAWLAAHKEDKHSAQGGC